MQVQYRCYTGSLKTGYEKGKGKTEKSFMHVYLNSKILDSAQNKQSRWEGKRQWNNFAVIVV